MTSPFVRLRAFCVACVLALPIADAGAQVAGDASGPLHQRALKSNGHLTEVITFDTLADGTTLREIYTRSEAAVVGRVLSIQCRPNQGKSRLETVFAVRLQGVLRGPFRAGELIYVSIPGGAYRFTDGALVEQRIRDYRLPRINHAYVFMLERHPAGIHPGRSAAVFAAGPQSQFELDFENDVVVPGVLHPRDPIAMHYRGMAVAAFLRELHER